MTDEQFSTLMDIFGGLYIQSLRNYDLLCLIADKLGAEVIELKNLHEEGYVLAPDPSLRIDDETS